MDELERRVRAARPISGHRDLPLSDRAKRELAELMLADSAHASGAQNAGVRTAGAQTAGVTDATVHSASVQPHSRRRRRVFAGLGLAAGVAAAAVVGVIAVNAALAPPAVYAATPPLLPITATDSNARELLTELSKKVRDAAPGATPTSVRVETWTLPTNPTGEATADAVVPQVMVVARATDGSGSPVVVVQGAPGSTVEGPGTEGNVVVTFAELPDNPAEVAAFFESTAGAQPSAAEAIQTMNKLLFEQVLSQEQQAALLAYFAELPDITAAGTTVDRLDRDGAVFAAVDPAQPDYEQRLIVSPQTGRILGTEVVYVGPDRTDIDSPAVVHYTVWD